MDESKIRLIVDANIDRLKTQLNLKDWEITIEINSLADDSMHGMCDALVDYQKALIILDPASMDTEKEVLSVLTHELLHIITATFHVYKFTVNCFLTEQKRNAVDITFRYAEERVVAAFCRIIEKFNDKKKGQVT